MIEMYMTSKDASEASRSGIGIYQVHDDTACQSWLPQIEGRGKSRRYNRNQLLLLSMHSDLVRWGMSIPFAGRLVTRMAETLLFAPDAGELVIEFHVNGASFFYGVKRHDLGFERSDAARAAGSARFKLTLDLAAYREAVNSTFAIYGRPVGDDDAG